VSHKSPQKFIKRPFITASQRTDVNYQHVRINIRVRQWESNTHVCVYSNTGFEFKYGRRFKCGCRCIEGLEGREGRLRIRGRRCSPPPPHIPQQRRLPYLPPPPLPLPSDGGDLLGGLQVLAMGAGGGLVDTAEGVVQCAPRAPGPKGGVVKAGRGGGVEHTPLAPRSINLHPSLGSRPATLTATDTQALIVHEAVQRFSGHKPGPSRISIPPMALMPDVATPFTPVVSVLRVGKMNITKEIQETFHENGRRLQWFVLWEFIL